MARNNYLDNDFMNSYMGSPASRNNPDAFKSLMDPTPNLPGPSIGGLAMPTDPLLQPGIVDWMKPQAATDFFKSDLPTTNFGPRVDQVPKGPPGMTTNQKWQTGLDVAKTGLGFYNAYEAAKMNDFMRDYYGEQLDFQRADFSNRSRSVNEALSNRAHGMASRAGHEVDSEQYNQMVNDYMSKWSVDENV